LFAGNLPMLVKGISRDELYQAVLDLVVGRQSLTYQQKQLFELNSAIFV